MSTRSKFLAVDVHLAGKDEVLSAIHHASHAHKVRVSTLNPEFMLEARWNERFRKALSSMTHCTVDGSGLAGFLSLYRMAGGAIPSVTLYHGADLVQDIAMTYSDGSKSIYLVGGPTGLAEQAAHTLQLMHPNLVIAGAEDGGTLSMDSLVSTDLVTRINNAAPDILLVGFGAPKQDCWIAEAQELRVPVAIGVGGTFGFYTTKKRAPKLLRNMHLEWLWRTVTEVGHARRAFRATVLFPLYALSWLILPKNR